jgi:hypothetical protein
LESAAAGGPTAKMLTQEQCGQDAIARHNISGELGHERSQITAVYLGDPDMPADEIQAAIDRADAKRRDLEAQQPFAVGQSMQIQSVLPRAAEMYRRQVNEGLNGNASAAVKASEVLRELFGDRIDLKPEGEGELWVEYGWQLSAVLQVVGFRDSGGRFEL